MTPTVARRPQKTAAVPTCDLANTMGWLEEANQRYTKIVEHELPSSWSSWRYHKRKSRSFSITSLAHPRGLISRREPLGLSPRSGAQPMRIRRKVVSGICSIGAWVGILISRSGIFTLGHESACFSRRHFREVEPRAEPTVSLCRLHLPTFRDSRSRPKEFLPTVRTTCRAWSRLHAYR